MLPKFAWTRPQSIHIQQDWELSFISLDHLPILVGLTGPTKSGKTIVANLLVTKFHFHYEDLSSVLFETAQKLGKNKDNWKELGDLAIILRNENGEGYFAETLFNKIKLKTIKTPRIVIDGILHPGEVNYFRDKGNFLLIGFDVSANIRIKQADQWYSEGGAEKYIKDRDEFEQVYEDRGAPYAHNVGACMKLADYVMKIEDFTDETLNKQAEKFLGPLLNQY